MTRRRIAAIIIACVFCMGLVYACGTQKAGNGSATVEDNGPMTLFLAREDEWLMQLEDACTAAAAESGYTLNIVNAKDDADKQISQIAKASEKGEGAFLVNLVDPSRADEAIAAAGNRDVVFVNRAPTDLSLLDEQHIYVGSEESEAGVLQGQVLAEYCHSEGMKEIRYLLLSGPETLDSSTQRADAVLQAMEDTGFVMTPVCDPLVCDYDRKTAKDAVLKLLMDGMTAESVDCVISTNDAMALGAIEAFDEAKSTKMPIVIGVDGISDALAAVENNLMMMTAYQDAERQAQTAVQVANNLNHGYGYKEGITVADRVDDYIFWISFQSITQDNVGPFLAGDE